MENRSRPSSSSTSSLRWGILREAFLSRKHSPSPPHTTDSGGSGKSFEEENISRKTFCKGFNLIIQQQSHQDIMKKQDGHKDVHVTYTLPYLNPKPSSSSSLVICQRVVNNHLNLTDFDICNRYNIDNTGLVCPWPSEDVLAYYCLSHAEKFRSKRILELGAGYGLAGLVIAASTDALEVVISDGNPQVVDYLQHNIKANSASFSDTKVTCMMLHWNEKPVSDILSTFDIIVASDCTFFKEFHDGLARTIKSLLKHSEDSEAIFLCPKRGNSLDKFLEKLNEISLHFSVTENYDKEVWLRHQKFLNGDESWPNYEKDHSYPLLVRITF